MSNQNYFDFQKQIGDAFSSQTRIQIIDYLRDRDSTVEKIAQFLNTSFANTSKHLKVLTEAMILRFYKDGNFRIYSINPEASTLINEFFKFTYENISEIQELANDIEGKLQIESYHLEDLDDLIASDRILIDVRPSHEYDQNHIEGAINVPLKNVFDIMRSLPKNKKIIAYCRGPHCLISAEVAKILNDHGYQCVRLIEGYEEWKGMSL